MEHLSFEEIVNAIYATDNTPETRRLIAKVNSHVMQCPDCGKIHQVVYNIYDLGFENGIEAVEDRLRELESIDTDIIKANQIKKYITRIVLGIENKQKIVLSSIKNLGAVKHYYSYPMALATRGGEQTVDMSKLIDDENIDNEIVYSNGLLKIQFSKLDYTLNKIPYPCIEIISNNQTIYEGPFDEDGDKLFKIVSVEDADELHLNVWEQDGK